MLNILYTGWLGLNTGGAKLLQRRWKLMRYPARNGLLTCTSNEDLSLLFNKKEWRGKRETYDVRSSSGENVNSGVGERFTFNNGLRGKIAGTRLNLRGDAEY